MITVFAQRRDITLQIANRIMQNDLFFFVAGPIEIGLISIFRPGLDIMHEGILGKDLDRFSDQHMPLAVRIYSGPVEILFMRRYFFHPHSRLLVTLYTWHGSTGSIAGNSRDNFRWLFEFGRSSLDKQQTFPVHLTSRLTNPQETRHANSYL